MVCCLCSITFILAIYNIHVKVHILMLSWLKYMFYLFSNQHCCLNYIQDHSDGQIFSMMEWSMVLVHVLLYSIVFQLYQPSGAFKVLMQLQTLCPAKNYFPMSRFVVCWLSSIAFFVCPGLVQCFCGTS